MERLRELRVPLPTLTELARPDLIPDAQQAALAGLDPDEPLAANLWRVSVTRRPEHRTPFVAVAPTSVVEGQVADDAAPSPPEPQAAPKPSDQPA
ncbi:hypothetical protein D3C83_51210 [compost metagenome]